MALMSVMWGAWRTVQEDLHVPLQIGAGRLRARADRHGLTVEVVGWGAGLKDVRPHVLQFTNTGQNSSHTALKMRSSHIHISPCTHIISCDEQPDSIRPSAVALGGNLRFWHSNSRNTTANDMTWHMNMTSENKRKGYCFRWASPVWTLEEVYRRRTWSPDTPAAWSYFTDRERDSETLTIREEH